MKVFKNFSITAAALLLTLPVISGHHEEGMKDPMKKNVMTAKNGSKLAIPLKIKP